MHDPVTKFSIKEGKNLEKPWLTKEFLQSIKQRSIIQLKFIISKEASSKKAFFQELLQKRYKYYKNLINKSATISKVNSH